LFTAPASDAGWFELAILWIMFIAGIGWLAWKVIYPTVWTWIVNHPARAPRKVTSFPAYVAIAPVREARMVRIDAEGNPVGEWLPVPIDSMKRVSPAPGTVQNPSDPSPRRRQR